MDKQDIVNTVFLLDDKLRDELDRAKTDIINKYRDSINHRLIAANVIGAELNEFLADLLKISEEITERYMLRRLQEIDELLKINPNEFNNYIDTAKTIGLAYAIRFHLQHRKDYERVARDKAKKGDWRFFTYCTDYYNQKADRKPGGGRKSAASAEDEMSFEASANQNKP